MMPVNYRVDKFLIRLFVYTISFSIQHILQDSFDFKSFYLIESYKKTCKITKVKNIIICFKN